MGSATSRPNLSTGKDAHLFSPFREVLAICEKELRSMKHSPWDRLLQLVRPMIWLVLFGSAGAAIIHFSAPTGANYQQFMLPGILLNTVLVTSVSYGINLKWEFDLGILNRMLVAPISRFSIAIGKALSPVFSSLLESVVFLVFASLIGVNFSHNIFAFLLSAGMIVLFSVGTASLGMIFAIILKSREAYAGVVGLVSLPSLFASNSLFSLNQMPLWMQLLARINPVTYGVDFVRQILVYGSFDPFLLLKDFLVVVASTLILLSLVVALFQRIER